MKSIGFASVVVAACAANVASAQVENGDLRIKAKFVTPDNGQWGADESVGNADFRIHSRFMAVYYGGVLRADEFRFKVQFDYTDISGFDTEYAISPYNADMDVYINDDFVGRATANNTAFGISELEYDSRHPDPPALLLPADFPEPVEVFDVVRVFVATGPVPAIGDPLPSTGTPIYEAELVEEFARGDVNQDGHVDDEDFPFLANHYDPFHVLGPGIGPVMGDFTGDNRADQADFTVFVANWDSSQDPPAEPTPIAFHPGDADRNGSVNVDDLNIVLGAFGQSAGVGDLADLNADGFVDVDDLNTVLSNFGLTP